MPEPQIPQPPVEDTSALPSGDLTAPVFGSAQTPEVDVPALPDGNRIGPYQILSEIGRGGMGVVYLAVRADDEYRKRVAVKLVPAGMDAGFIISRFRRERQILATLEHPNICRLLDGGTTSDNRPYFIMEYIEGEPIDRYADSRRLSITERLKLFRQVCAAVQYAHQNLVVHRDLKPGNILVTPDGIPKLLDFGIAKLLNPELYPDAMAQTVAVVRAMTPDYASPEQVRGQPVTTASDVYSLGVLLYELMTGHRPYRVRTVGSIQALERVICEQEPERPSRVVTQPEMVPGSPGTEPATLAPEVLSRAREGPPEKLRRRLAGDLDNIVLMAMRKEPQRRYASVDQLSEDLRRHLEGLPVLARKDTLGYRSGKFLHRHKVGAAAVTLVLCTLIGGIVATTRQARVAERRFQDVRKLANSVVFELHDAIQNLPGSTPARKLLVQRALEYLDRLAQEAGNDLGLQLELAAAYQKIGDVQGNPYQANLGDQAAAAASYRKSLAIREKAAAAAPSDPRTQTGLVSAYKSLGDLLASGDPAGTLEYYRKANAIDLALAAANPGDNRLREELAGSLSRVGEMQWNTGDSQGALSTYGKALDKLDEVIRAEPENRKALRNKSTVYNRIGFALSESADPAAALENFEKAKGIRERLAAADPTNASAQRDLWLSYNAVADVLGNPSLVNLGRRAEALNYYRKALAIAEALAEADPKNIRARRDIGLSLTRTADVLKADNKLPDALAYYRKALAINQSLQAENPQNNQLRIDYGIQLERIATALALAGDNRGALEYYSQALVFQEKMALADPKNASVRQIWLQTVQSAGDFFRQTGDVLKAGEQLRRGREEAEKMLSTDPASVPLLRMTAEFSEDLGDWHAALASAIGTPQPARTAHWREAEALYQRAFNLGAELRTRANLTPEDDKAIGKLTRKLAHSTAILAAARSGVSAR